MMFVAFSSGCGSKLPQALPGLPGSIFAPEPAHIGPLNTVGQLAEAFVVNTTALRQANNKLGTICIAAQRCEKAPADGE